MTALSATVTNTLYTLGPEPSTLWDATGSLWDVSKWDEGGTDIHQDIIKLLSESQSSTTALFNLPFKLLSETQASTSAIFNTLQKILNETETPAIAIFNNPQKILSETQSSTTAIFNTVQKLLSEAPNFTTAIIIGELMKLLSELQAFTTALTDVEKFDGTGTWNYDFPDYTKNFESMSTATYTNPANNSTTWTTVTTNVVGWS